MASEHSLMSAEMEYELMLDGNSDAYDELSDCEHNKMEEKEKKMCNIEVGAVLVKQIGELQINKASGGSTPLLADHLTWEQTKHLT
jgi:hypothetical protein